jgi:3-dehydroquinate dehydratase-2
MLGKREPKIYGIETLPDIEKIVQTTLENQNSSVKLISKQTNSEGELIDWIHEIFNDQANTTGIILNPGAFTHYSYGLRDALAMLNELPFKVIELHISNPNSRELFRSNSVVSPVVTGTIAGFGTDGYRLATLACLQPVNK